MKKINQELSNYFKNNNIRAMVHIHDLKSSDELKNNACLKKVEGMPTAKMTDDENEIKEILIEFSKDFVSENPKDGQMETFIDEEGIKYLAHNVQYMNVGYDFILKRIDWNG